VTGRATCNRVRELPRWLAKTRANLGGYFWLPCRVCGRMYGGFECSEVMAADKETGELLGPNRPPGIVLAVQVIVAAWMVIHG
jgi:hypothetical protein